MIFLPFSLRAVAFGTLLVASSAVGLVAAPAMAEEAAPERSTVAEPAPAVAEGSSASGDEQAAREADMFGDATEPDASLAEETPAESTQDAEVFGDEDTRMGLEPTNTEGVFQRLMESDDSLDIGGQLILRLGYRQERGEFPENFVLYPEVSSPNLMLLYLDARPNDRVRAFAQTRLSHDFTIRPDAINPLTSRAPSQTTVDLDQLWLRFDVGRQLYLTAGRQHLRWGTGRFWNPTDFLSLQRRDPLAIFDERLGAALVKAHLPVESLGWNFYAVANLEGAAKAEQVSGALRAEFLVGPAELSLSAASGKDSPLQLGTSLSSGLGPLDVRAEVALLHDVRTPVWRGEFIPGEVTPFEYDRREDWMLQAMVGAEVGLKYSDEDSLYVGAEYFFNDAGYEDASLYPWLVFRGAFRPFYTGRHYGGLYALLPSPGGWNDTSFVLSALGNLSDGSFVSRLDYSVRVLTHLSAYAWGGYHFGQRGEFMMGLDVPPIPDLEGFEAGLSIPEPWWNAGMGLRLSL